MRSLVSIGISLLTVVACKSSEPEPPSEPSTAGGAASSVDAAVDTAAAAVPAVDAATAGVVERQGWKVVEAEVRGSVNGALGAAIGGDEGAVVAAHYARIFMWDLDLRREVDAGDRMQVAWRNVEDGDGVQIGAARYVSGRKGKTFSGYRFTSTGDAHASFWGLDGRERAGRLKDGPLLDYEQVTALLKDRPTHGGMDFKTPEGTEIRAPKAGVITRQNWRLRGNGNCLELRFPDGVVAKFLHLSAAKVKPGTRVRRGQLIALTGNTGRSTAPHLHYQLERARRILDPIDYHGLVHRKLAREDTARFAEVVQRMDEILPAE